MIYTSLYARRINGTIVDFTETPKPPFCGAASDSQPMMAAAIEDGDRITFQLWVGAVQDDDGISSGGWFETRHGVAVVTVGHYEPDDWQANPSSPTKTSKSYTSVFAADENGRKFQTIGKFYGTSGYPYYNVQPECGSCGYDPKTPAAY